jgi:hypothetical protein
MENKLDNFWQEGEIVTGTLKLILSADIQQTLPPQQRGYYF